MDNSKPQAFIFMKVGSHGCESSTKYWIVRKSN